MNSEKKGLSLHIRYLKQIMNQKKQDTFINLFAGCGGLSEGFYCQGFKALAHVEIDHWACVTCGSGLCACDRLSSP